MNALQFDVPKGSHSKDKPVAESYSDEKLSCFHALGKVLYAKEAIQPEIVVEKSRLEPAQFIDYLHENMLRFLDSSESHLALVGQLEENYSASDLLRSSTLDHFSSVSLRCGRYPDAVMLY